ncbi:MAG: tetratricopeptide repeat protein [Planctomycetota bacterium]|nr:tetratricopeptide repeat protein [Planctomycetota bacterium]
MKRLAMFGICVAIFLAGCAPSIAELRSRGIGEFQVGHIPQARQLFQQVLERNPVDTAALYYTGRIHHAEGFYEQAIYYYQCSLDADPRNAEARTWLEKAQSEAGLVGKGLRFIP